MVITVILFFDFERYFRHFIPFAVIRGDLKTWLLASLYGAGDSLTHYISMPGIGAVWFLWALFFAELMMQGVLRLREGWRFPVILLIFAFGYLTRKTFWLPLSFQSGCCALLFLYFGKLLHDERQNISQLHRETKAVVVISSFVVWFFFIRDFQSFWLVKSDVGRGAVDIFGSLCACLCLMVISKVLCKQPWKIVNGFAFLGQYSIMMLSAHLVELNTLYGQFIRVLTKIGVPSNLMLYGLIVIKLIWAIFWTVIGAHWSVTRWIFGIEKRQNRWFWWICSLMICFLLGW